MAKIKIGEYKNLLFDLGGVIMDIKRERCVQALERLGMADAGEFLGDYVQSGPFLQLENGDISAQEFRDEIRRRIGSHVTDNQIDDAMNQVLIGIQEHRLDELTLLHKSHNIYMLSNTNPIMFHSKIRTEFEQQGLEMNDYFDGIVTSFRAHASKPNPQIFRIAIEQLNIIPEETIFFDDSQKNLDAASLFGFRTCLVSPGTEFFSNFEV